MPVGGELCPLETNTARWWRILPVGGEMCPMASDYYAGHITESVIVGVVLCPSVANRCPLEANGAQWKANNAFVSVGGKLLCGCGG